ncbi:MAG: trehalose-phosphatase [Candidatus Omnitrophica bacterium]|nr:trehalose-phosphatase [Candidatus Omnitrophota bacterium]
MDYLFESLDKIKEEIKNKELFLFLDYDGTLTPIVETPDKAILSKEAKRILERLTWVAGCRVAIVSGRGLEDIQERVGLKNVIYVGNHGLEAKWPTVSFKAIVGSENKEILTRIKMEIFEELTKNKIDHLLIEDKNCTLSIHYRLVDPKDMAGLEAMLKKIIDPYVVKKKIKVGLGKKVVEILPPVEWDKGKAVIWLLDDQHYHAENHKILPIYIGDDLTDESAFKALEDRGITIMVGNPKVSYAKYYLNNSDEVLQFLTEIEKIM